MRPVRLRATAATDSCSKAESASEMYCSCLPTTTGFRVRRENPEHGTGNAKTPVPNGVPCPQLCYWARKPRPAGSDSSSRKPHVWENPRCNGRLRRQASSPTATPEVPDTDCSPTLISTSQQEIARTVSRRPPTVRRRYAITSSPPRCASTAMASFKATMAHSTWSSAGGCVVMRCSHRPGAVMRAKSEPRCLAAKRIIS